METKDTYYILRDGVHIWLAPDLVPLDTDAVLETRPTLIASEGKVLVRGENIIGKSIWLKDTTVSDYTEIDEPIEEEEIIEEESLE